jgi:hypothetical protein
MYYKETIPFIILVSALKEVAIRKPLKGDAIEIAICKAAFVNSPIICPSALSYSMFLILVPAAIIFAPISVSVDARPAPQAILIVSLVDISVYKCCNSLAMKIIIK